MASKICNQCGKEKPLEEFHKFGQGDDIRRPDCKVCCAQKRREARYNREAKKRFHDEGVTKYAVISEEILNQKKKCTNCGEIKQNRSFYYHKQRRNFYPECKVCRNERARKNRLSKNKREGSFNEN